ncbi:MAG: D-alanyl-D-alanine dipeptidase, partial [Mesorhizobium sp.]
HPPLSCRTSPPQGGRLDVASAFANHQRWKHSAMWPSQT